MGRGSGSGHHGSVVKVGKGTYRIRVMRNGVKKSQTVKAERVEDAQRIADVLWESMGSTPEGQASMTLGEYWEACYAAPDGHLSHLRNDGRSYRSIWKNYISPRWADVRPADMDFPSVQTWIYSCGSPANQRKVWRHFRAIVTAMWKDGRMGDVPKPLQRVPHFDEAELHDKKATWTKAEVVDAMGRMRGDRLELLFLVMAGAGLRREEALALVVPDDFVVVERDGGKVGVVIRIFKTMAESGEVTNMTKTGRAREVTIGEPFSSRIAALLPDGERMPVATAKKGGKDRKRFRHGNAYVSKPSLTPSGATQAWHDLFRDGRTVKRTYAGKPIKDKIVPPGPLNGLPYIELESLRHTNISLALDGGANVNVVAASHGNSPAVIRKHYYSSQDAWTGSDALERALHTT